MEFSKEREVQGVGDNTATCTCQQCNENLHILDTKPTYNPSGEIVGRICNHCRIKNVEYARRCQILGCNTSDGRNSGFRILPSKFYDLEEGDVKIRIVKQFGITESTRACCNVCYMRISKAIVQMKIVYGDGILKTDTRKKTAREINSTLVGSAGSRVLHNKEAPVVVTKDMKESRASAKGIENEQHKSPTKYTGPQFKRKYGAVSTWLQQQKARRIDDERVEPAQPNLNANNEISGADNKNGNVSINVDNKLKDAGVNYDKLHYGGSLIINSGNLDGEAVSSVHSLDKLSSNSFEEPRDSSGIGNFVPLSKSTNLCLGGVFTAGGLVVQSNVTDGELISQPQSCDNLPISQANKVPKYSTVSLSPTTTRFCRILPKPSELIQDKLATATDNQVQLCISDHAEEKGKEGIVEAVSQGPAEEFSKEVEDAEEPESDFSSGDTSSTNQSEKVLDKGARRQRRRRSELETQITSDIVSCMGCHKICSVREAKPVFDYEKGFCGRLCNDCRIKKREDNKKCPIKGCKTSFKDVVLKPVPPRVIKLKGKLKQKFTAEYGLTNETKVCCRVCWKRINNSLKNVRFKKSRNAINKDSVNEDIAGNSANSNEKNTHPSNNTTMESPDDDRFTSTTCHGCHRIVRMNQTIPKIENDGRRCGVLCRSCAGTTSSAGEKGNLDSSLRKSDSSKMTGVCRVKDCVSSGYVVSLVSCGRLLRTLENERIVRKEFDLAHDNNACCRSCLSKIKWFINSSFHKEGNKLAENSSLEMPITASNSTQIPPVKKAQVQTGFNFGATQDGSGCKHGRNGFPLTVQTGDHVPNIALPLESHRHVSNNIVLPYAQGQLLQTAASHADPLNGMKSQHNDISSSQHVTVSNTEVAPVHPSIAHPPVLQVGGQQFVLNVIRRTEQTTQTDRLMLAQNVSDKSIQCNSPPQLNSAGQIASVRRVTYQEAKEKTKYIIKKQGKQLFDQFLAQLDEISGGCGKQLLQDVYYCKETVMALNYEKILSSLGAQYHDTQKTNKTEKLRILSLVALNASNELLKRHFQRPTKKGELTSVTEGEIAQAREYAKQFGPGAYVMPEKVAELSKHKSLLLSPSDGMMDIKEEMESSSKESPSDGVIDSPMPCAAVQVTSTVETNGGKNDIMVGPAIQGAIPACVKSDDSTKEKTVDVKATAPVEMVQFKILKNIAGVPVVDFGSSLPCKSQITSSNVPLIATFKYKPTLTIAPTQIKDTTQVVSAQNLHPVSNLVLANLGPKERLNKKLKKKALHTSFPCKKMTEEKEKGKKSPNKLKFFKRSKMVIDTNDPKNKRMRTSFTREEREMLEQYFQHSMYVTKDLMKIIQGQMGLDKKKIDTWFRNRRSKAKKAEVVKGPLDNTDGKISSAGDSILSNCSDNSTSADLPTEEGENKRPLLGVDNIIKKNEIEIPKPDSECQKGADTKTFYAAKAILEAEKKVRDGTSLSISSLRNTGNSDHPTKDKSSPQSPYSDGIDSKEGVRRSSDGSKSLSNSISVDYLTKREDCRSEDVTNSCVRPKEEERTNNISSTSRTDKPSVLAIAQGQDRIKIMVAFPSRESSQLPAKAESIQEKNISEELKGLPSNDAGRQSSTSQNGGNSKQSCLISLQNSLSGRGVESLPQNDDRNGENKNDLETSLMKCLTESATTSHEKKEESGSNLEVTPKKSIKKVKVESVSPKKKKEDTTQSLKDGKIESDTISLPSKDHLQGTCGTRSDVDCVKTSNRRDAGDKGRGKSDVGSPVRSGQGSHDETPISSPINKRDVSEKTKGAKNSPGSPRTSKREGAERSKYSRYDVDGSRGSKRDESEDRVEVSPLRSSRKEANDKLRCLGNETETCDSLKRETTEISRRSSKDKSSCKKVIVDEEEKPSSKRRRRSRAAASEEKEGTDGVEVDEEENYTADVISAKPQSISGEKSGVTAYETRSRAR